MTAIQVLLVFDAIAFLLAASTHLGLPLPGVAEPRIIDAAIVEGVAGIFLAVAAFAVFARTSWARGAAVGAQAFASAGVLVGIAALAAGAGPSTQLNFVYHRVMLLLLVVGLILVISPFGRGRWRKASS